MLNRRLTDAIASERKVLLFKNDQYILKKELANRFRVSTSTIERWASNNIIPKPIRFGPNRVVWDRDEIKEWEKNKKLKK